MKFDEAVFELIDSTWKEYEEELYYDAISGELMDKDLVKEARKVEMETSKKRGVCEKAPAEESWKNTGKKSAGVKLVDASRGDRENPEYRCRLVAKETKKESQTADGKAGIMARHASYVSPGCQM